MLRVVGDCHRARGAGEEIQVVDVIPWPRNHSVVAAVYQDDIVIPSFHGTLAGRLSRIEMLESKAAGPGNPVIVDFVQIRLFGWIVCVVFVRRIAGPVSS